MANDDFTPHKFRALQDLVLSLDHQYAKGDVFELTADAGAILVSGGLAEPADEPEKPRPPRGYNRRDQQVAHEADPSRKG